jgi:hypothetical protein
MSILVRKIDDVWQEWHGSSIVTQIISTYTAVYADGRQIDTPCDPYPIEIQMNGDSLLNFYDQGIWTRDEVVAVGGRIATPFAVPEGKQALGAPQYEEGQNGEIRQTYQVEDIPEPPPPPSADEKVSRLLAGYDLSVSDLKSVLGLGF